MPSYVIRYVDHTVIVQAKARLKAEGYRLDDLLKAVMRQVADRPPDAPVLPVCITDPPA